MRVTRLKCNSSKYTSNSYLIRGNWNKLDDVNTLIDTGVDDFILDELQQINTGVGKKKVEQVIITHEHFDHAGGLKAVIELFHPKVFAFKAIPGATDKAIDGIRLIAGDSECMLLHTPGHSNDSICIYFNDEKTIFTGDTQIMIRSEGGTYSLDYLRALERLYHLDIDIVYSGHDEPMIGGIKEILANSIEIVRNNLQVRF